MAPAFPGDWEEPDLKTLSAEARWKEYMFKGERTEGGSAQKKDGGRTGQGTEGAPGMVPFLVSRKRLGRWKGSIPRQGQTLFKRSWQENTAGPRRMNVAN